MPGITWNDSFRILPKWQMKNVPRHFLLYYRNFLCSPNCLRELSLIVSSFIWLRLLSCLQNGMTVYDKYGIIRIRIGFCSLKITNNNAPKGRGKSFPLNQRRVNEDIYLIKNIRWYFRIIQSLNLYIIQPGKCLD